MILDFVKYHGTGNDFVMVDGRQNGMKTMDISLVQRLCDRHFGIGADGLIIIHDVEDFDLEVNYYNADGSQSLCGNGSRCAVMFAYDLGWIKESCSFKAIDGGHTAEIKDGLVHLKMGSVDTIEQLSNAAFLDTGSPHHIEWVNEVDTFEVVKNGRKIRHDQKYAPAGTNVNFVEILDKQSVKIRTFERGVEDETLACGTGAVAAALAASTKGLKSPVSLQALGGELSVAFEQKNGTFDQIYLIGPAVPVFKGKIEIDQ